MVSEIWHGEKWLKTLDRHALSPMFDDGRRHYFIDEPVRTKAGETVIPIRWLEDEEGKVWFQAWRVVYDNRVRESYLGSVDEMLTKDRTLQPFLTAMMM